MDLSRARLRSLFRSMTRPGSLRVSRGRLESEESRSSNGSQDGDRQTCRRLAHLTHDTKESAVQAAPRSTARATSWRGPADDSGCMNS